MTAFERACKRGLIRLAGSLLPSRRPPASGLRRILLVRVDDRLGNLILLSPAIEWLHRQRPEVRIGIVLSKTFATLYASDPRVDRMLPLHKGAQKIFFPVFLGDLARVAAAGFDATLECSDRNSFSFNSALYARASAAPRRIGFGNDLARYYLTETVQPAGPGHAAHDPLLLAGALLGMEPPGVRDCRLSLHLPRPTAAWTAQLDALESGSDGGIVGIHVGGRSAKRWPFDSFVQLIDGICRNGFRAWIFHGPMEAQDAPFFRSPRREGVTIMPQRGIAEVGQAFMRCRVVVAPDTGPMHLASAVGTPTLALFLNSDPDRYRPLGSEDRWIDARGQELPADRVLEEVLSMLRLPCITGVR